MILDEATQPGAAVKGHGSSPVRPPSSRSSSPFLERPINKPGATHLCVPEALCPRPREAPEMPQKREAIRPELITRIQVRLIVMLLGTLILMLLKRYGVL